MALMHVLLRSPIISKLLHAFWTTPPVRSRYSERSATLRKTRSILPLSSSTPRKQASVRLLVRRREWQKGSVRPLKHSIRQRQCSKKRSRLRLKATSNLRKLRKTLQVRLAIRQARWQAACVRRQKLSLRRSQATKSSQHSCARSHRMFRAMCSRCSLRWRIASIRR